MRRLIGIARGEGPATIDEDRLGSIAPERKDLRMKPRAKRSFAIATLIVVGAGLLHHYRYDFLEKRVRVVEPGRLLRGAWQRPLPLKRLIQREHIKTIVSLAAIREDDPKYVEQKRIVAETGVGWDLIPMPGSTATVEQMDRAADLLADRGRQPVLFHCIAGHHRTSLAHAAYRLKHDGWSVERAWAEVQSFPWARGEADSADRERIEAYAEWLRQRRTTAQR